MHLRNLPIAALPAWAKLNQVNFQYVKINYFDDMKGNSVVVERVLSSKGAIGAPLLIKVPYQNILSAENIQVFAKADSHFRELLVVAGGRSLRQDVMLYLLLQISSGSESINGVNLCLSSPWTEYVMMLPKIIPVPTMWQAEELCLLIGTSLEAPVNAKLSALQREFENLREQTFEIPWCSKYWWETGNLNLQDWLLLDAWYRSRSLELPNCGQALVPCLDMVNHSLSPNAYFEPTFQNEVSLVLRPDTELEAGSEITISYGASKSEAEMLYSYGFVDQGGCSKSLTLSLDPLNDDPLKKAKLAAFPGSPNFQIFMEEGTAKWKSPFVYFVSLNEEDGLEFKTLQQVNRAQNSLQVLWQGSDVSSRTEDFEILIMNHALCEVFKLRAVTLLQDRVHQQLERLRLSQNTVDLMELNVINSYNRLNALRLRDTEKSLLEVTFETLEKQKALLLESDVVVQYLSSFGTAPEEHHETSDDECSFS